jgi:hypothetical protein
MEIYTPEEGFARAAEILRNSPPRTAAEQLAHLESVGVTAESEIWDWPLSYPALYAAYPEKFRRTPAAQASWQAQKEAEDQANEDEQ